MSEFYPVWWAQQFFDTEHENGVKTQWAIALVDLTGNQISIALDACRKNLKNPPSIAEFIAFGKGVNEIPQAQHAFAEACEQAKKEPGERIWSHPLIHATYAKIGSWRFRNDTEYNLRRQFSESYLQLKNDPAEIASICAANELAIKIESPPALEIIPLKFDRHLPKKSTASIGALVEEGAKVCRLLKKLHTEVSWPDMAQIFIDEKKKAKRMVPETDDLQILLMMQEDILFDIKQKEAIDAF